MDIKKLNRYLGKSFVFTLLSIIIFSCQDKAKKNDEVQDEVRAEFQKRIDEDAKTEVITILTNAMEFQTKDEFPSGWNTIRYKNRSNETHLILFDKYPEGKGLEDTKTDIVPPFQQGMDLINEGKIEEAGMAFGKLPEWFQEVEFVGGVGLISPKSTAQSTLYLEPGTYIIECYVKMPNGVFHTTEGMAKQIEVVENNSGMEQPDADYSITISANEGIVFDENVSTGKRTFAVNFGKQKVHEHYLMHDVNLVWIEEGADISKLNSWVNWSAPDGLQTPAPAGFKFLGGMQEMKEGGIGYFTVDLKSGKYALIAEVPDPQSKGMLKTFTVN
ncbi:hypothetical protein [Christiangramia sp.]|uniref:hypothetical protein n=1 Tax=Christiangramia sp. TaxID=1931228 RepID=UPI0026167010|nr:hypothetical protein [Christiangramia sp.]